jgi:protein tyrosine phosphatase (PTP) superfamily phosphohydrolase (DUF442 family)
MSHKAGQPGKDGTAASVKLRHQPTHRSRVDGVGLGFLLFMSVAALGGGYGAMILGGNFHEVVPGRVYRSGQPAPEQLRVWIQRYGLKTIVNLRGPTAAGIPEEEAVAKSMGVEEIHVELGAYEMMPSEKLVCLIDVLQTAKEPMLLHCYHGVDRAGTASALAAWLLGKQAYGRAKWQAYVPPGPWKRTHGSAHISDVLTTYEDYCRQRGLSPDDPSLFQNWARNVYRPQGSAAVSGGPVSACLP